MEESHFLVVNKPAGLLTQASPGVPSLQTELTAQIKERDAHIGTPFVGLPHRLDRVTSGAMLIARNQRALKRFGLQFQSRKIEKSYLAVVEGCLPEGELFWEDFVRKVPGEPVAEVVSADVEGARLAQLNARQIATDGTTSLVEVRLLTGRMHQIRVQAAARGHPIVGDTVYRGEIPFFSGDTPKTDPRLQFIALHAVRLGFRHPQSGLALHATAPLPDSWLKLSDKIVQVCSSIRS